MKKKSNLVKLDFEEKELLASFESDEWKSVKNVESEKSTTQLTRIRRDAQDFKIIDQQLLR